MGFRIVTGAAELADDGTIGLHAGHSVLGAHKRRAPQDAADRDWMGAMR